MEKLIIEVCPESLEAIFAEIERGRPRVCTKGRASLRKSKIGSLNPRESEWILRFFTKQINPRSLRSWCVKGTEESSYCQKMALLDLSCLEVGKQGVWKTIILVPINFQERIFITVL